MELVDVPSPAINYYAEFDDALGVAKKKKGTIELTKGFKASMPDSGKLVLETPGRVWDLEAENVGVFIPEWIQKLEALQGVHASTQCGTDLGTTLRHRSATRLLETGDSPRRRDGGSRGHTISATVPGIEVMLWRSRGRRRCPPHRTDPATDVRESATRLRVRRREHR